MTTSLLEVNFLTVVFDIMLGVLQVLEQVPSQGFPRVRGLTDDPQLIADIEHRNVFLWRHLCILESVDAIFPHDYPCIFVRINRFVCLRISFNIYISGRSENRFAVHVQLPGEISILNLFSLSSDSLARKKRKPIPTIRGITPAKIKLESRTTRIAADYCSDNHECNRTCLFQCPLRDYWDLL